jgi:hypothetical protein
MLDPRWLRVTPLTMRQANAYRHVKSTIDLKLETVDALIRIRWLVAGPPHYFSGKTF